MTEVIHGEHNTMEDVAYEDLLEQQDEEWGPDELDHDAALEGVEVEGDYNEQEDTHQTPRRESTNDVIARLDTTDPTAAENMREMQRAMSRQTNEWNELRTEMLEAREQLVDRLESRNGQGESADPPEPANNLPAGVTDEHLNMFQAMADHFGLVPRSELEAEKADANMQQQNGESLRDAITLYGDDFGTEDENGNITIHPENQEAMRAKLAEITNPDRGINPQELYNLTFPDRAQGGKRQAPAGRRQGGQRSNQRPRRMNVARQSTGGSPRVRVYDPTKGNTPGNTGEDVLDRIWALSKRELTTR